MNYFTTEDAHWLNDPKWINAAKLIYYYSEKCKFVFTIEPLCRLRTNCLPLAFLHLFTIDDSDAYAIITPKDDIDKLPLSWLENLEALHIHFADDVYFAATSRQIAGAAPVGGNLDNEMIYCFARRDRMLRGTRVRVDRLFEATQESLAGKPYCLIVNAALAGNVGEALLAHSAVRLVNEVAPHLQCIVADPDIDRATVANAALIVIGPGGMLYDLDDHDRLAINLSNIAVYFRIGFLAQEYGIPYCVLGVGVPAPITSGLSQRFIQESLRDAKFVHLRDNRSLAALSDTIKLRAPVVVAPDVSIVYQPEIAAITRSSSSRRRLVACGSFNVESLAEIARRCEVDLRIVLQGTEDVAWLHANREHIEALVPVAEIIDVHQASLSSYFEAVADSDCLLSTRFHAMMIGLMAGLKTVVVGVRDDKRSRVKQELGNYSRLTFIDSQMASDFEFVSICCARFSEGERSTDAGYYAAGDLVTVRTLLRYAADLSNSRLP